MVVTVTTAVVAGPAHSGSQDPGEGSLRSSRPSNLPQAWDAPGVILPC